MPQRRTRAAPYPSLCSTCRRVNYQQFHQGVGILWLHLQIASVQKLRSLLYAVPQVLQILPFLWPHVYSLPDLSYQTLRDRRFQVPRLATCIRPHRTKLLSHPATNNIESTRRGLPQRDTTTRRRTIQYHHIASKCTSKEAAQNEQIIEGQRNPSHENYALVCLFPIKPQVFHPKNPCCKFQVYPILGILANLGTGLHEVCGHSVSFQAFASGAHFFATLQSTPSRAATPCSVHTQPRYEKVKIADAQLPWHALACGHFWCVYTCNASKLTRFLASETQPCLDQNRRSSQKHQLHWKRLEPRTAWAYNSRWLSCTCHKLFWTSFSDCFLPKWPSAWGPCCRKGLSAENSWIWREHSEQPSENQLIKSNEIVSSRHWSLLRVSAGKSHVLELRARLPATALRDLQRTTFHSNSFKRMRLPSLKAQLLFCFLVALSVLDRWSATGFYPASAEPAERFGYCFYCALFWIDSLTLSNGSRCRYKRCQGKSFSPNR